MLVYGLVKMYGTKAKYFNRSVINRSVKNTPKRFPGSLCLK